MDCRHSSGSDSRERTPITYKRYLQLKESGAKTPKKGYILKSSSDSSFSDTSSKNEKRPEIAKKQVNRRKKRGTSSKKTYKSGMLNDLAKLVFGHDCHARCITYYTLSMHNYVEMRFP